MSQILQEEKSKGVQYSWERSQTFFKPVLVWFVLAICSCCYAFYRMRNGHIFNPDSVVQITARRSICSDSNLFLFLILGDEPKHRKRNNFIICTLHLFHWRKFPGPLANLGRPDFWEGSTAVLSFTLNNAWWTRHNSRGRAQSLRSWLPHTSHRHSSWWHK